MGNIVKGIRMSELFKIFIDRLKDGHSQKISEEVSSEFLDMDEQDLSFAEKVTVEGESYLADDHIILHLKITTSSFVPCSICNEIFEFPIEIDDFYHAESLEEIPAAIFDFSSQIREAILLQVPPFSECHEGNCPERKLITPFLKKLDETSLKKTQLNTHFPFADLEK